MSSNDQIIKVLNEYGNKAVSLIKENLIKNGKDDSNIIKNIKYEYSIIDDNNYLLKIILPDYWVHIQYGRKQNSKMPPKVAIETWMKRKNIDLKYSFPIRRKIGIDGIKPINLINFIIDVNSNFNKEVLLDLQKFKVNEVKVKVESVVDEFNKQS